MTQRIDIRAGDNKTNSGDSREARPWVSVWFDCCKMYQRVYRNVAGTAYVGRCPRCLASVTLKVGPGGTASRSFTAR